VAKILLVEDDKDLALLVREWLEAENYSLDIAHDGMEGYEFLRQGHYDVVVLDWDLPRMTGLEICQKYRATKGVAPILMLTGRGQIADKEMGLDAGADDYLAKPFHMRELSARLRALGRRPTTVVSSVLTVGNLELDTVKHRLCKGGVDVHLLPKDFALLEFLMRHPDEIFSSEAILQRVWNLDTEATSDAVRTSVKRLRKKLDESDDEDSSVIENVRRIGYRLRAKH
jgi:two-component system, OmpR family, response regulator